MDVGSWAEGQDGDVVAYRERLWPHWWVWLFPPALTALLAVAFGAAYATALGWAIFLLGTGLGWLFLIRTTPEIRVDDRVLRAGRARLPLAYAADPVALDADATTQERRHGDARDFLVLRPWASPESVCVTVVDPDDPHPRWLVTSRRPVALRDAIEKALAAPA